MSVPFVCGLGAKEGRHKRKGHWLVVGVELSKKVYFSGVPSYLLT